jgi:hypothetical protein
MGCKIGKQMLRDDGFHQFATYTRERDGSVVGTVCFVAFFVYRAYMGCFPYGWEYSAIHGRFENDRERKRKRASERFKQESREVIRRRRDFIW